MELTENMASSDHTILRDRTYIPTKRSLLELSSQDVLLAQNKLLSKQREALTETLSYAICGGAHDSGCCISTEDHALEVNFMGNQPRQNFNAGGFSGFQQSQNYNQQYGQWRAHPENNPKEECKAVMTHGRMATMAEEEKDEKMVDGDKQ
ncbi:hypothetical protein GmHk_16G046743 [Glycine max]|nr:hypothetical protein GmHk_16G046743 [Glycine max]